jgi:hypothetical protein
MMVDIKLLVRKEEDGKWHVSLLRDGIPTITYPEPFKTRREAIDWAKGCCKVVSDNDDSQTLKVPIVVQTPRGNMIHI